MKIGLLAVLTVVASGAVLAQQPAPTTFRSATNLVEVDVSVVDENGTPVRGLPREAFNIPGQSIVAFQEVSHDVPDDPSRAAMMRVPHDVADNRVAHNATIALIVFDDTLPADARRNAQHVTRRIVDELGPGVQIGLMSTSGKLGMELTDDRARLLKAIDTLAPLSARLVAVRSPRMTLSACNYLTLEQAARLLAPMDALRKVVIAVTPGCGTDIKGAVDSMRPRSDLPAYLTENEAVEMVDAMRRANVGFFAVDPRGEAGYSLGHFAEHASNLPAITPTELYEGPRIEAPGMPSLGRTSARLEPFGGWTTRMFDPVVLSQEGLEAIGKATGGLAITNAADIDGGINRIVNDLDHFYLLGFTPKDSKSSSFQNLNVIVDHPGVQLRYRRGYQLGGVKKHPGGSAALPGITGVLPTSDVAMRMLTVPFATSIGTPNQLYAIEVTAPRSEFGAGPVVDDVTVTVVAVRTDQAKVERAFTFKRQMNIDPKFAGNSSDFTYQIVREMDLPPGPYQFRVSLTSAKLNRTGSVYITTDVPDYGTSAFDLSGPLVTYADANRHPAAATVVDRGVPVVAPVFDRVFTNGDALRILAPIWRKAGTNGPTTAKIELIDEQGHVAFSSDAPIRSNQEFGIDAVVTLKNLAPAPYRLRVSVDTHDQHASREIGLLVR